MVLPVKMEQMSCKDKRLRMTNEVLSGIRAVKLYAWEAPMMAQIEEVRRQEIQLLRRAALLRTSSDVSSKVFGEFVRISWNCFPTQLFSLTSFRPSPYPFPLFRINSLDFLYPIRIPYSFLPDLHSNSFPTYSIYIRGSDQILPGSFS